MKEFLKKLYDKYSSWIITLLIVLIVAIIAYFSYKLNEKQKIIDGIEYTDSTGTYNKSYLEGEFSDLKKQNRELYDSLKKYKEQIDYIVQFTHKQEYHTGVVTAKPVIKDSTIHDTVPMTVPQVAKTYEYKSEEADTFQYKLNINSFTEPN